MKNLRKRRNKSQGKRNSADEGASALGRAAQARLEATDGETVVAESSTLLEMILDENPELKMEFIKLVLEKKEQLQKLKLVKEKLDGGY